MSAVGQLPFCLSELYNLLLQFLFFPPHVSHECTFMLASLVGSAPKMTKEMKILSLQKKRSTISKCYRRNRCQSMRKKRNADPWDRVKEEARRHAIPWSRRMQDTPAIQRRIHDEPPAHWFGSRNSPCRTITLPILLCTNPQLADNTRRFNCTSAPW